MKNVFIFFIFFLFLENLILAQNQSLIITAKSNSETMIFFEGDELKIAIQANRDCYFKVYHIDSNNEGRLIYPNTVNPNNLIKANQQRIIPEAPMKYSIQAPFGQDTIMVIASERQFTDIENEITLASRVVGRRIEDVSGNQSITTETVSTRFIFTSKPNTSYDETFTYSKPANLTETVRSIRFGVQQNGGVFNGNNREGKFSVSGVTGNYRVTGDDIIFSLRYTEKQLPVTRGVGFSFSIDKPKDIGQAIQIVRSGIQGKGGAFDGNEKNGSFSASGIAGQYDVADKIDITIHQKPFVVPNSLIQKEITNFFSEKQ